jgi:hypothetical protein
MGPGRCNYGRNRWKFSDNYPESLKRKRGGVPRYTLPANGYHSFDDNELAEKF